MVHCRQPLVADRQTAIARQPGEGALDDPAMPAQPLLRLDPPTRDPVLDVAPLAGVPALRKVVALVGVRLLGPSSWTPPAPRPQRRDRVEERLEQHRVVDVRRGQEARERDALGVRNKMLLQARLGRLPCMAGRPSLPLSVGFGPVARPPLSPRDCASPRPHGSSRSGPPRRAARGARGGAASRPRGVARASTGASRSRPSHSPSPAAGTPTESPSAGRRESRAMPPGSAPAAVHPCDCAAASAAKARPRPTAHPSRASSSPPALLRLSATMARTGGFERRS